MKKFIILNSPNIKIGETYLKEVNPFPKVLIKEGLAYNNPEYDLFENKSVKNAILLLNPITDKKEYFKKELILIKQLYDESQKAWINFNPNIRSTKHDRKVFKFIG